MAETGGEVLAGVEAVTEGDVGDRGIGVFAKFAGGEVEAALVEVFHRASVDDFAAIFGKCRHAHAAMRGHPVEGPRFANIDRVFLEVAQEHVRGAAAKDEMFVFVRLLFGEGVEDADEELIEVNGETRYGVRLLPFADRAGQFAKGMENRGGGGPDGIFIATEFARQFSQVIASEDDPLGPLPCLVRAANTHIEDEPMNDGRGQCWERLSLCNCQGRVTAKLPALSW